MDKAKKLNIIGIILLLVTTIFWGTSFFILKETIEQVPVFYVIAIRFLLSGAGLCLIFIKKVRKMKKSTFYRGIIMGLILTLAYLTQTLGLKYTTPGRNAFLTASYCVLCPFLIWMFYKKKPKIYNIVAAFLCISGIGLIALSGGSNENGSSMLAGDALTLVSAIFYALQIIFIDRFQSEGHDGVTMLVPEIMTVGIIFALLSLVFELPSGGIAIYKLNIEQFLKIMYLTLICTLFGQFAQIVGQKFTPANQSSIILSLESVFGVFFSVLFGAEKLTVYLVIGFIVVFVATLISELKPDFSKIFKREKDKENCSDDKENISEEELSDTADKQTIKNQDIVDNNRDKIN